VLKYELLNLNYKTIKVKNKQRKKTTQQKPNKPNNNKTIQKQSIKIQNNTNKINFSNKKLKTSEINSNKTNLTKFLILIFVFSALLSKRAETTFSFLQCLFMFSFTFIVL